MTVRPGFLLLAVTICLLPASCSDRVAKMPPSEVSALGRTEVQAAVDAVLLGSPVVLHGRFDFNRIYAALPDSERLTTSTREFGDYHIHDTPISGPIVRDLEYWIDLSLIGELVDGKPTKPMRPSASLSLRMDVHSDARTDILVTGVRKGHIGETGWTETGGERMMWAISRGRDTDDSHFVVHGVPEAEAGSLLATFSGFEEDDVATRVQLEVVGGGSVAISGTERTGWIIQATDQSP